MEKIKIFITYKDKHRIIKTNIINPIQTGRAIADEVFQDMIGDDTGDNISEKNPRYNELSGQYWVWKNFDEIGNPDYIGFMHYRRHFIFDKSFNLKNKKPWFLGINVFKTDYFDRECERNLADKNILQSIEGDVDCIAIKPYDIQYFDSNDLYMKEHYIATIAGSKRIIWNIFYDSILKLYPNYREILDKFSYGSVINVCNMFIMKKELFFDYCEFCFNILAEVDNQINYRDFSTQELRYCGYLGEYLLTMYIMKLQQENKKLKFLDAVLIMNDNPQKEKRRRLRKLFHKIFGIEKTITHKKIKIFGITFKFNAPNTKILLHKLIEQDRLLNALYTKVSELQDELILKRH